MTHRSFYLDLARLGATFLVIALHMDLPKMATPPVAYWIVNGLDRIAVPFFFITTGFFLLQPGSRPLWTFVRRVLWLYGVWSLIYLTLWGRQNPSLAGVIENLTQGYWHLWYLMALAEAVVLLAVLRKAPLWLQALLAAALYLLGFGVEIWSLATPPAPYWPYRNGLFDGFPLVWLGTMIYRFKDRLAGLSRGMLVWSCLALVAVFNLEIAVFYRHFPAAHVDIYLSLAPLCALGVYLLATARCRIATPILARVSSGVYLVHVLVLQVLFRGGEQWLRFALVCAASTVLAFLLVRASRWVTVV